MIFVWSVWGILVTSLDCYISVIGNTFVTGIYHKADGLNFEIIMRIDIKIYVIGVLLTTGGVHHSPRRSRGMWWASQVVGDATMTEVEASISILL